MSQSADHFVAFEPHSQYKHLILEKYFEAWGRKLLLSGTVGTSLRYVDACAGKGKDDSGNPGSPIIAARAAMAAEAQLASIRGTPFTIRVFAIEKVASHFRNLVKNLEPYPVAEARRGTLADYLDETEKGSERSPTLYFIDPFGLEPLRADVVRRALRGGHDEALLLFADQAALRHYGAATAQESDMERRLREIEQSPGLFPEFNARDRQTLEPQAAKSRRSRQLTGARAVEILTTALGNTDWEKIIQSTPRHQHRQVFLELYTKFLKACGARYVLRIPVLNEDGGHVYHLIHATKSGKGYVAMKEAVEYALKHGPLPVDIVGSMRRSMRADLQLIEDGLRSRFAGKTVRWAEVRETPPSLSLRRYILEATACFPFELDALQKRLRDCRLSGRTKHYQFPSVAKT
jgi:three-Cys-motif partner protein